MDPLKVVVISAVVALTLIIIGVVFVGKKILQSSRRRTVKFLKMEVARAKRSGRSLAVLLLEMDNSVPRGVHEFLPGRTLTVSIVSDTIRETDFLERTGFRVYTVILTETNHIEGAMVVKRRMIETAEQKNWGEIKLGLASYPENGNTAKELLDYAVKDGGIKI